MKRKLGVNTWVWAAELDDDSLETAVRRVAGMGFTAVELPVENPGAWSVPRARDLLGELGLEPFVVGAMSAGRNLVEASDPEISATQTYLTECVDIAAALGARIVAGPFYAATGRCWRMTEVERRATYAQLVDSLTPVTRHAESVGVRLAIEPLNRYETSLMNTVEQALDALAPLFGPGLGLALDSYHLNIEEKSITDAIVLGGEHVAHVQVCGNDRGAVGDDHIDWPGFLDALDGIGYSGPLNLESFTAENETIAVAASIWRPLAASPDDLARRSLEYLTRLQAERYG
ncbi:sugar phosphate isomerase/epimerase [Homoserinimonas sp. OAct 916]|uniref:sugar phosphate isomerase/epimerase family protein n=1 Tax=Homoserinimonas sp. OAct 916 TaxID=2211450 RepID=UPI000DBE66BC|nr:sugar phosphate isomerase/epimerase family protein [Homoserinimonas sp. OAct 916]